MGTNLHWPHDSLRSDLHRLVDRGTLQPLRTQRDRQRVDYWFFGLCHSRPSLSHWSLGSVEVGALPRLFFDGMQHCGYLRSHDHAIHA